MKLGERYVRFVRFPSMFEDMLLPDLMGFTKDGRFIAIECKKPGWKGAVTERELKQQRFIRFVAAHKGLSGFVTSVDELSDLLKRSAGGAVAAL